MLCTASGGRQCVSIGSPEGGGREQTVTFAMKKMVFPLHSSTSAHTEKNTHRSAVAPVLRNCSQRDFSDGDVSHFFFFVRRS